MPAVAEKRAKVNPATAKTFPDVDMRKLDTDLTRLVAEVPERVSKKKVRDVCKRMQQWVACSPEGIPAECVLSAVEKMGRLLNKLSTMATTAMESSLREDAPEPPVSLDILCSKVNNVSTELNALWCSFRTIWHTAIVLSLHHSHNILQAGGSRPPLSESFKPLRENTQPG
jgi:hypothetical protein